MVYVAVDKDIIKGIHKKRGVVECFVSSQSSLSLKIMRAKKKDIPKYMMEELYLVRYRDNYIPSNLYSTMTDMDIEYENELQYSIDVINKVLINSNLSKSDKKTLKKAMDLLYKEIDIYNSYDVVDIDCIEELNTLDTEYKNKLLER